VSVRLVPESSWSCPNCPATYVTHQAAPHTPFHPCAGLRGLTAPFVPAGTRCKVEAVERGDYVNGDLVTVDGAGRPVMSVQVTRDEGTDVAVFAPCATAGREDTS
jgi:hypothetical protein